MSVCRTIGCDNPKTPGRGYRYCDSCREATAKAERKANVERTRVWRENNRERYEEYNRDYYQRNAETQRQRAREWHHNNPDRARANAQKQRAKRLPKVGRYGMTQEDYRSLLVAQNGCCAICGRNENGKRFNFDVDHCHVTGRVRGLLCNRCNRMLSNARDDAEVLKRAIAYLEGQL